MNRTIKDLGKYAFILFLAIFMAGCSSDEDVVNPTPTADFTFASDATSPGKIKFSNTSTNASSYLWEFGDGTTSTEASPAHTFPVNGTFQVKLTISSSANGGKLPGKNDVAGNGTSTTKAVTVSNAIAQVSLTANMQGQNPFTYTATPSSVAAWRTANDIRVRGVSSAGVIMELIIPGNAVAGGTYTGGTSQPGLTSISYTNSSSTYIANMNSCGGQASASIKVTSISPTSITGTFSGAVYNVTCNGGYFTIQNANFVASF